MKRKRKPRQYKRAKPIVRKGQTKEFVRGTASEIDTMTIFCRELVVNRVGRTKSHRRFWEAFKKTWQTCERYMRRARLELAAESGKDPKTAKCEAVQFYESIIASETSSESAKLRAQENLDGIFGNRAAVVSKIGNETDKPFKVEQEIVKRPFKGCTDAELEEIMKQLPALPGRIVGTNGDAH